MTKHYLNSLKNKQLFLIKERNKTTLIES